MKPHKYKEALSKKISNLFYQIKQPKCLYADQWLLEILNFVFDFTFSGQKFFEKIYRF